MLSSKLTLTSLAAMLALSTNVPAAPTRRQGTTGPVRTTGRTYRASPAYVRKTPSTPADFEALAKAQAKRDRKAAKLLRHGL